MNDRDTDPTISDDFDFTKVDAVTYVFGSSEACTDFMDRFVTGESDELSVPEAGAVGVYLDEEGNVVHVGRVRNGPTGTSLEGRLIVYHKVAGKAFGRWTETDQFPFDGITDVIWVKGPEKE